MSKIRILLTDDHTLFRQGIRTLLSAETDIDVVGEAANGSESVEKVGPLRPDVVLMDIGMPGLSSFEATRQIKKVRPETKILFLTMYDDEDYLVECMEVGGSGYVLKDSPAPQLLAAIRDVYRGGSYLSPKMPFAVGGRLPHQDQIHSPAAPIRDPDAERERDPEVPGGRPVREGNRHAPEPQREDR